MSDLIERTNKCTETHACDCISREAAIEALRDEFKRTPTNAIRAMDTIKNLPSAQPERKMGLWMPDNRPSGGFWVCSECKFPSEAFAANVLYKFCPNCGADMRGEQIG